MSQPSDIYTAHTVLFSQIPYSERVDIDDIGPEEWHVGLSPIINEYRQLQGADQRGKESFHQQSLEVSTTDNNSYYYYYYYFYYYYFTCGGS